MIRIDIHVSPTWELHGFRIWSTSVAKAASWWREGKPQIRREHGSYYGIVHIMKDEL